MVGRIWEKMFATTYGREPSTEGWSQNSIIAMAPVDAAIYYFMSKSAGLPVYNFLGGYRDTVRFMSLAATIAKAKASRSWFRRFAVMSIRASMPSN